MKISFNLVYVFIFSMTFSILLSASAPKNFRQQPWVEHYQKRAAQIGELTKNYKLSEEEAFFVYEVDKKNDKKYSIENRKAIALATAQFKQWAIGVCGDLFAEGKDAQSGKEKLYAIMEKHSLEYERAELLYYFRASKATENSEDVTTPYNQLINYIEALTIEKDIPDFETSEKVGE